MFGWDPIPTLPLPLHDPSQTLSLPPAPAPLSWLTVKGAVLTLCGQPSWPRRLPIPVHNPNQPSCHPGPLPRTLTYHWQGLLPRAPRPVPAYADSVPKSRNCFMDSGDGENLLKCSMYLGAPARDAFFHSARTQRMATAPAVRAWFPLLSRGWRRWHRPSARPSTAGRRASAASSLPLPWRCLQRLANRLAPAPQRRQWSRTNNSGRTNSLALRHVALLGAHPLNREGAGGGLLFS